MEKAKKIQLKKITTWVLLAALVAYLAAMPLLAKSEAEAKGPVATVHSGTVETGTVRTELHGGGNLTTKGVEDVKLPTGVKITEFLVKNGARVGEGTPLAAVDKVSVMSAIVSVTETMEYLQEEIQDARDDTVSSTVTATAGGRIKKLYARKGDSVQDVILEHGALALLSLDGLMAVKMEEKMELPTGSVVTVTFSDGSEAEGRVESNLDGVIVVTVEDTGYEIGQTVSVTRETGEAVGSGQLYVHNAWTATAFSGTVQTVYGKEETKVSAGASLFTLTDTDFQGNLDYMASLHREYEQLLQDLFRMYTTGTIDAPCGGVVSGIDKDSPHLLAAGENSVEASLLTAEEPAWSLVLLSEIVYEDGACGSETCPLKGEHVVEDCPRNVCDHTADCPANPDKHDSACIFSCDHADAPDQCDGTGNHYQDCIKCCENARDGADCPSEKHYLTCVESCNPSDGTTLCPGTGDHRKNCIKACTHADTPDACKATVHHYPDCIKACITSDSGSKFCPASKHNDGCFFAAMTYKARVAVVTDVGSTALVVRWDASGREYQVENTGSGWQFAGDQGFSTELLVNKGDDVTVSNPKAYKQGDVIFVLTGYKGSSPEWSGVAVYQNIGSTGGQGTFPGGFPGMGGFGDLSGILGSLGGFNFGSLGGFSGFSAAAPVEEEPLFDLEGSVLMQVSPEDRATLTVRLDEQDIARVSLGQKATVKVEALGDERFEATVTEIATRGENSGGSSKFAVKLELAKARDMLDGMSATAAIPIEEKEDVLTIPVAALGEQGGRTVVYTALDEEGKPADPVPVTIGISDGVTAEILSGLEAGDAYYYSYYDVLEEDTGVEDRFTLT